MELINDVPEQRDAQRLSDQITRAFYEACRIGNLDAAKDLARALEFEIARSKHLFNLDRREDGSDIDAVYGRLKVEMERRIGAGNDVDPSVSGHAEK